MSCRWAVCQLPSPRQHPATGRRIDPATGRATELPPLTGAAAMDSYQIAWSDRWRVLAANSWRPGDHAVGLQFVPQHG